MTFDVTLDTRDDIKDKIISRLKSKGQIAIVKCEHDYAFSIYWSKKKKTWMMHIDPFNTFGYTSEHGVNFLFALFGERVLKVHTVGSPEFVLYEIRSHITETCLHATDDDDPFEVVVLKDIFRETHELLGQIVGLGDVNRQGILVGLSSTLEDLYYIYMDTNGKLQFETCVTKLLSEDKLLPDVRLVQLMRDPNFDDIVFKQRMKHFVTNGVEEVELVSY